MRARIKRLFPQRWNDWVLLVLTMAIALDLSLLLEPFGADAVHASLFYVLAVLVVSRYTDGYLYGTLASIISVLVINYAFVPPYFAFDLDVAGLPLTFITMFALSISVSTLTSHVKKQEEMRIEAERERLRANLLRAVGHDLRTPLTSIIGSANFILENEEAIASEEKHTLLFNIQSEAAWMIDMVENLLFITRVGGSSYHIKKTPEIVEEIVGEVANKFSRRFPEINVDVNVPEALLEVPMDAMLIEQVLFNLMENSAIHGKAKRIWLHVQADADKARFTVTDDGVGVPEERLAHLFDDYVLLAASSSSDKKRNMGIGLMVCRDIVKVHDGTFEARNRPEGNAEFAFTLPLEDSDGNKGQDTDNRGRKKHTLLDKHHTDDERL